MFLTAFPTLAQGSLTFPANFQLVAAMKSLLWRQILATVLEAELVMVIVTLGLPLAPHCLRVGGCVFLLLEKGEDRWMLPAR